jgi:hypothetical protein
MFKTCSKCGYVGEIFNFRFERNVCKACTRETKKISTKKYRDNNHEKVLSTERAYEARNIAKRKKSRALGRTFLSNSYIKTIISTDIKRSNIPNGLIEAKRQLILIRRILGEKIEQSRNEI